jgi:hypothetical protein
MTLLGVLGMIAVLAMIAQFAIRNRRSTRR